MVIILITQGIIISQTNKSFAQASSFYAMYFQNQYLTNPAMAGFNKGMNVNLGYLQQFNSVPGSPKLQYLTADYGAGNNVGLGLNINSSDVGLINSTRLVGSYAYHLQVSEESKLNFGLSLGFDDNYIDYSKIVGNQGDVSVNRYNSRAVYVDGDFGIAYTSKELTIQAAIPNLKGDFFKLTAQDLQTDMSIYITSLSYKFFMAAGDNIFVFEPLVGYRGFRGTSAVADGGFNFDLPDYDFSVSAMYHTNNSASFGFGLNLNSISLLAVYTASTAPLKTLPNNTFEIGLRFKFLNKADNQ